MPLPAVSVLLDGMLDSCNRGPHGLRSSTGHADGICAAKRLSLKPIRNGRKWSQLATDKEIRKSLSVSCLAAHWGRTSSGRLDGCGWKPA